VDLGDGVLRSALRAEAVGTRLEVRLEDRLEHHLEGGLHHPIPHGRDAQPAQLAAGLGDHPLPHGQGLEHPSLQIGPELGEEHVLAPHGGDVIRRLAIHSRRAGPPVAPDPTPRLSEDSRVADEVVEVVEPTIGVVGGPSVQLGLDLRYPTPGQHAVPVCVRSVGVHRRPRSLPVPQLRTRCPPSPCGRLSRPRTTTGTPPHLEAVSRRRTCPPPTWPAGGEGDPEMVPTFTADRSTGVVPSSSPAAWPRVRRRPSSWSPSR
jgi:hypothetical protein